MEIFTVIHINANRSNKLLKINFYTIIYLAISLGMTLFMLNLLVSCLIVGMNLF